MYDFSPETFWAVVVRRSKYILAIALSAVLFCTLGWAFAAPPPEFAGVSLMPAWSSHGLMGTVTIFALLLATTLLCSLIVHPDSPHMGLACALLGMAGLAIRGGTISALVRLGQGAGGTGALGSYEKVAQSLALECVQWAVIFLIAEVLARLFHDRFLKNTHWITRSGPEMSEQAVGQLAPGNSTLGAPAAFSKKIGTHNLGRRVAMPLAVVFCTVVSLLLLAVFMQTERKGQVLMACFMSFFLATMLTYVAFPRVPLIGLLLVVPLTAIAGYLYGMNMKGSYPGQAGCFAMRALPIDYISAGVPGAIFGYYAAFRWSLHSEE